MVTEESAEAEKFRQEVRTWLMANLPEGWGTPGYVAPEPFSKEAHELGQQWTKKLYDAGYTGFGYPKEYGGVERPAWETAIIRQEMARTGTHHSEMWPGMAKETLPTQDIERGRNLVRGLLRAWCRVRPG